MRHCGLGVKAGKEVGPQNQLTRTVGLVEEVPNVSVLQRKQNTNRF